MNIAIYPRAIGWADCAMGLPCDPPGDIPKDREEEYLAGYLACEQNRLHKGGSNACRIQ